MSDQESNDVRHHENGSNMASPHDEVETGHGSPRGARRGGSGGSPGRGRSRSRSGSHGRGRRSGRGREGSPRARRHERGGGSDNYEREGRGSRRSRSKSPMSSRRRHNGTREAPDISRCLGIFGLSIYTQERDLKDVFGKYGPIDDVQIVYDAQTGRSRGFCFVYFESENDAKEAKERCNGIEIDGRKIRVDFSITKRAHTPTPGVYMGKPTARRRSNHPRDGERDRGSGYERGYERGDDRGRRDYGGAGGGSRGYDRGHGYDDHYERRDGHRGGGYHREERRSRSPYGGGSRGYGGSRRDRSRSFSPRGNKYSSSSYY